MRVRLLASASVLAIGFSTPGARAQETTTYQYDGLGRLVTTQVSGGPNGGTATSTSFDPAGNRTAYAVANAPSPTPNPTPTPSCTIQTTERGVTLSKYGQYSGNVNVLYSQNCSATIVISYSMRDGSAVAPYNYLSSSGTITIQPGQHDVPIMINGMQLNGAESLIFYIDFTIASGNATLIGSFSQVGLTAD